MKTLLIAATLAFIAAGIYGAIDVSRDVKNGTFIQYEDEDKIVVEVFGKNDNSIVEKKKKQFAVKNKASVAEVKVSDFSMSDIKISDFSRGEPPMLYEAMLLEKVGSPDSAKNADVISAINDTIAAINEKANEKSRKDSSNTTKKEERKFSLKLYSRGRPRPIIKETVAVQSDSTKK
jgi:hypothetical protein